MFFHPCSKTKPEFWNTVLALILHADIIFTSSRMKDFAFSRIGKQKRCLQSHKYFFVNIEIMKRTSFFWCAGRLKFTKNSCLEICATSPKIQLKIRSIKSSLTEHVKNKCRGVSLSSSWFSIRSQKVQFEEWPCTKCATALLYPAVLLWSLKRKVLIWLEK